MASLVSKSYSKKLLRLISWSHWFTFFNICAAILLSSSYLFAESAPETLFGQAYLIATWFSHMAFLTFIAFVLVVFPITLLLPYTRVIRGFASLVFTITLVVLVLDAFTYQALGYHLNASSSEQIFQLIQNTIAKDSQGFWTTAIAVTLIILIFELVVSNYAWKHIHQLQQTVFAKYTMFVLVAAFVFSHISHIWADANLEYDVLKQDTLFPLSYPATAKTLLTKYGLFDKSSYIESTTSPLGFDDAIGTYPVINNCPKTEAINRSVYVILNKKSLNDQQISQFIKRARADVVRLARHIDNANSHDAWFNFFYGLPTVYQADILAQNKAPLTLQLLDKLNFNHQLTIISKNLNTQEALVPSWVNERFNSVENKQDVKELIFDNHFSSLTTGLHVYYFNNEDDYQLELFVDALLLDQENKKQKDIVWVSSLGNEKEINQLAVKPALLIWPQSNKNKLRVLTSQMDIPATLMNGWLNCAIATEQYTTGDNILSINKNRVVANTREDGIMIFEKDKSVFVDQLGNFQGYSRQLNSPISINADYPLMINGVRNIKKYTGELANQAVK